MFDSRSFCFFVFLFFFYSIWSQNKAICVLSITLSPRGIAELTDVTAEKQPLQQFQ